MKNLEITYEALSCIGVNIVLEQFSNCTSGSRGALGVERGAKQVVMPYRFSPFMFTSRQSHFCLFYVRTST